MRITLMQMGLGHKSLAQQSKQDGCPDPQKCLLQSGIKLLFAEIKIALRLINKALHGHTLTR